MAEDNLAELQSVFERILIVDAQPIFRRGVAGLLSRRFAKACLEEASDVNDAAARLRKDAWDLVILDLWLPDGSGLDLLKELRKSHPEIPVLVVSTFPEDQYAVEVLRCGGVGYLTKSARSEELMAAVERVLSGKRYISARVAELLVSQLSESDRIGHELLSPRELQVLIGLASGRTVTGLAMTMRKSVKTISTFRRRVLTKMGMNSNAELIRYAIRHGLIE